MNGSNILRLGMILTLATLIISTGLVNVLPEVAISSGGVVSATATSDEGCSANVQQKASIGQSSIQAVDDQITTDQPALISGQIVTPQSNQCVVVVQMILTIPTDMYVAGTDDVGSSGQGKLSATFRLSPGETKSMSAQVYASSPGSRVLIADFLYYPAGHPDKERRLSGFSMEIQAVETNMPDDGDRSESPEIPIAGLGFILVVGVLSWLFR